MILTQQVRATLFEVHFQLKLASKVIDGDEPHFLLTHWCRITVGQCS